MAAIEIGNTKVAARLIRYCEKKATERDGYNVDPERAKEQFRSTRQAWGKTDGVQAHHVIQSFKPGEIDPVKANEIGRQLAEKIAPNFEVAVYTHTDKEHIHNHIVINAVSFVDGKKYHSDLAQLYKIRELSDELCIENGLSVIKEPFAPERFTMAEYKLAERGVPLWKDELRTAIDEAKQRTANLNEMREYLKNTYDIEMKIQQKNVSFLHPEKQKFVRGKTLGANYTREGIEREYSHAKSREIDVTQETTTRGTDRADNQQRTNREFTQGINEHGGVVERDPFATEYSDRELHGGNEALNNDKSRASKTSRASQYTTHETERDTRETCQRSEHAPERPSERVEPGSSGISKPEQDVDSRIYRPAPETQSEPEGTSSQTFSDQHGERSWGSDNISTTDGILKSIESRGFKSQLEVSGEITEKLWNNTGRTSSRAIYKADPETDRKISSMSNEIKREISAKLQNLVEKIPEDIIGRPPLVILPDEAKALAIEISDNILQQNGAGTKYLELIQNNQGEKIASQKYQQLKVRISEQVVAHAMKLRPYEIPKIEMMAHEGRVQESIDKLQTVTGNYILDDKEEAAWTTRTMYRSFVLLGQDEQTAKELAVKWAQSAGVKDPDKIISSEIKRMQKISEKCKEEDKPEPVHVSRSDWEHMRDNLGLDEEELLHPWFGIVQMGQQLNKFSEVIPENVEPVIQDFQQATSYPHDYKEINWTVKNMTQTLKALEVGDAEREQIVRGWVQRSGVEISEPRLRDILDRIELADSKYSLSQENWERLNNNLGIANSSELPWRNSVAEKLWFSSGKETSRLIYKTDFEADRSILSISNDLKSYITQNLHDLAEKIPEDVIGRPPLGALPDDVKTQAREIADRILQHNGGGDRYRQLLSDRQGEDAANQKIFVLRERLAEKVVAHAMELLPREIPEIEMKAHEGRIQEAISKFQNVTGDFIRDNQDEAEWTAGTMYRSMLRMGVNKDSAQYAVISWSQSAGVKEPKIVLDNAERYMDFIVKRCKEENKPEPVHVSKADWERMRDNLGLEEEELLHPWFGIKQDIDSDKETSSKNIEYQKPEIIQEHIQPFINSIELASACPTDYKELNWTMRAMTQTLYALDVKETDREMIIRGWVQRAEVKISEPRLRDLLDRTEIAGRKEYFMGRDNWQRLNQNLGIDSPSSLPWKFEGQSMSMAGKLWKSAWQAVERERTKAEAQMQTEKLTVEQKRKIQQQNRDQDYER